MSTSIYVACLFFLSSSKRKQRWPAFSLTEIRPTEIWQTTGDQTAYFFWRSSGFQKSRKICTLAGSISSLLLFRNHSNEILEEKTITGLLLSRIWLKIKHKAGQTILTCHQSKHNSYKTPVRVRNTTDFWPPQQATNTTTNPQSLYIAFLLLVLFESEKPTNKKNPADSCKPQSGTKADLMKHHETNTSLPKRKFPEERNPLKKPLTQPRTTIQNPSENIKIHQNKQNNI